MTSTDSLSPDSRYGNVVAAELIGPLGTRTYDRVDAIKLDLEVDRLKARLGLA